VTTAFERKNAILEVFSSQEKFVRVSSGSEFEFRNKRKIQKFKKIFSAQKRRGAALKKFFASAICRNVWN